MGVILLYLLIFPHCYRSMYWLWLCDHCFRYSSYNNLSFTTTRLKINREKMTKTTYVCIYIYREREYKTTNIDAQVSTITYRSLFFSDLVVLYTSMFLSLSWNTEPDVEACSWTSLNSPFSTICLPTKRHQSDQKNFMWHIVHSSPTITSSHDTSALISPKTLHFL